ncbi:MAG: putative glycolipid-binding domain-containing protein [Dehalococcoidia bacterium]
MSERLFIWKGTGEERTEAVLVDISDDRLLARGTQIGLDPEPYELRYRLETGPGFVTELLQLEAVGDGFRRTLELRRDVSVELDGVPDCDIAFSPLTNTMPILRHRLHERAGVRDFVMAWVSVPDLKVHSAGQRYEHLAAGLVRFATAEGDFTADLRVDADGLLIDYPGLARRLHPPGG